MNLTLRNLLLCLSTASLLGPGSAARAGEPPAATLAAARTSSRSQPAPADAAKRARPAAMDEATRGQPRVAPRMLDDIRIEGEIPVPQVLFITARDQRRFMEFQHHRYQLTCLELGRATPGPSRLVVTSPSPDKAKQEDPR